MNGNLHGGVSATAEMTALAFKVARVRRGYSYFDRVTFTDLLINMESANYKTMSYIIGDKSQCRRVAFSQGDLARLESKSASMNLDGLP